MAGYLARRSLLFIIGSRGKVAGRSERLSSNVRPLGEIHVRPKVLE